MLFSVIVIYLGVDFFSLSFSTLSIYLQFEDSCLTSVLKVLSYYFLNISSNLFFPSGTQIRLILEVFMPYISLFL